MKKYKVELVENELDEEFQFTCPECGTCYKQKNFVLSPYDVFRAAKELNMTNADFFKKFCISYIDSQTPVPSVELKSMDGKCALLNGQHCMLHEGKPKYCSMFPVGRTVIVKSIPGTYNICYHYFVKPFSCDGKVKNYTIRSWLAAKGIDKEDPEAAEFIHFKTVMEPTIQEMQANSFDKMSFWGALLWSIYLNYDTSQDFFPQFQRNLATVQKALVND